MGRAISNVTYEAAGGPPADNAVERVAKCIPGEIVVFFTAVLGFVPQFPANTQGWTVLGCFIVGLIATPISLLRWSDVDWGTKIGKIQIVAAMAAFAVWAFASAGALVFDWYQPVIGAVLALAYGLLSGYITAKA